MDGESAGVRVSKLNSESDVSDMVLSPLCIRILADVLVVVGKRMISDPSLAVDETSSTVELPRSSSIVTSPTPLVVFQVMV